MLTREEETRLAEYCTAMAGMGLRRSDSGGYNGTASAIVGKTGQDHLFKSGMLEGLVGRFYGLPSHTHSPHSSVVVLYSYCLFKQRDNGNFFAKLGATYLWIIEPNC